MLGQVLESALSGRYDGVEAAQMVESLTGINEGVIATDNRNQGDLEVNDMTCVQLKLIGKPRPLTAPVTAGWGSSLKFKCDRHFLP